MSSGIDEFLDHVDQWKLKVQEKLKRMTALQRKAFWHQIHEQARAGTTCCRSGEDCKAPD